MAQKLKNLHLTSVDMVRSGANQEADICLYKSAYPQEDAEAPTERETNIFKRFINWLRENPAEAEYEPEDPIEKADEQPEPAEIFKSAITESIQSIVADESLSAAEKNAMIEKSIEQYHGAMVELYDFEVPEGFGYSFDLEKSAPEEEEELEEVEKYNHNHGADGRFVSGGGGGGAAVGGSVDDTLGELNGLPTQRGISKVAYEDIKTYEKVLNKFPVGTKLSRDTDAGTELFERTTDSEYGVSWKHTRAPWGKEDNCTAFDVARWMAGSGAIKRGPIKVNKSADYDEIEEV